MHESRSRLPFTVLFLLVLGTRVGDACAEQPTTGRQHAVLMEKKLASAQEVFAGLARRNFPEIEKQSQMLMLLSHEAAWNIIQTQEYLRLSDAFRATTKQLQRAAEDHDSDAVGLAYIKLTISCIDCHRYSDEQQAAKADSVDSSGPDVKDTQ